MNVHQQRAEENNPREGFDFGCPCLVKYSRYQQDTSGNSTFQLNYFTIDRKCELFKRVNKDQLGWKIQKVR